MRKLLIPILLGLLSGCSDDDSDAPAVVTLPTIAETSDISVSGSEQGVTPFIHFVSLTGLRLPALKTVSYVIEPKPGSASRPVHVTYTLQALKDRGYLETNQLLKLPVFALYAGYANPVSLSMSFSDGSIQSVATTVQTDVYVDPNGIYDVPVILRSRAPGSELGFDFFALKTNLGTPAIVDTDGTLRWVAVRAPGTASGSVSIFSGNEFVMGNGLAPEISRLQLDGTFTTVPLATTTLTMFHHNLGAGRSGFLGEFITADDFESTVAEFDLSGNILKVWDFAQIVADYMVSMGDDPGNFVRRGSDWFHSNAAIYDPRDDSVVVSSRENFVIKVDYDTGEIIWILGDPTKHWWLYPSLRAKALAVDGASLVPIGQHALSITADGLLMLFNNGYQSGNQPPGTPAGSFRDYSAVSAYRIDESARTATEEWRFDNDMTINSRVCSSVYEVADQSLLVNYSHADNGTRVRVVGLNEAHEPVFDLEYLNRGGGCATSWNGIPIPLEDLRFE